MASPELQNLNEIEEDKKPNKSSLDEEDEDSCNLLISTAASIPDTMPISEGNISEADLRAFTRWIMGLDQDPPHIVNKMMSNLANKLRVGGAMSIVANVPRQSRLLKFIQEVENDLFDADRLVDMTMEDKLKHYERADKAYNAIVETQRKFIAQNGTSLEYENTPADKIRAAIESLPPEQMENVLLLINTIKKKNIKNDE